MPPKLNITGRRFGRLVAIRVAAKTKQGAYRWLCKCDCGNETIIKIASLMEGNSRSCGCLISESTRRRQIKHDACNTPEYAAWQNMKARCLYKSRPFYKHYGGRGIVICDRWLNSFENFLSDMGLKPSENHTLDRYPNVNGNYEPSNCRWADRSEQSRNKRSSRWLECDGARFVITDWADMLCVTQQYLGKLLKRMTIQEAFIYLKLRNYA